MGSLPPQPANHKRKWHVNNCCHYRDNSDANPAAVELGKHSEEKLAGRHSCSNPENVEHRSPAMSLLGWARPPHQGPRHSRTDDSRQKHSYEITQHGLCSLTLSAATPGQ